MLTRLEQITDEIINLRPQQVTEGEYMITKVNQRVLCFAISKCYFVGKIKN